MAFCVMVKGLCRGRKCDFWARIRIKKMTNNEIIDHILKTVSDCNGNPGYSLRGAIDQYWTEIGIRDMDLLCKEEPILCLKIKSVEEQVMQVLN